MKIPKTDIGTLLRERGLRATPQRMAMAEYLLSAPSHSTPQRLYEELKDRFPSLSPNTVYMTLGQFEERGLLRRVHIGGQAVFDSNLAGHDHAYCTRCGRIMDIATQPSGTPPPRALKGWAIEGERCVWYGVCEQCKSA